MAVAGMPVIEIPQDSTAAVIRITIVDETNTALDVSGGTSVLFFARTPDGTEVVGGDAGSYTDDGTDGVVEFAATAALVGTARVLWCEFEIVGLSGGNLITKLFALRVNPRARVSA